MILKNVYISRIRLVVNLVWNYQYNILFVNFVERDRKRSARSLKMKMKINLFVELGSVNFPAKLFRNRAPNYRGLILWYFARVVCDEDTRDKWHDYRASPRFSEIFTSNNASLGIFIFMFVQIFSLSLSLSSAIVKIIRVKCLKKFHNERNEWYSRAFTRDLKIASAKIHNIYKNLYICTRFILFRILIRRNEPLFDSCYFNRGHKNVNSEKRSDDLATRRNSDHIFEIHTYMLKLPPLNNNVKLCFK